MLVRVLRGTPDANIRFDELCQWLNRLGFAERVGGDHHIFTRGGVEEILNLPPRGSLAKAYPVKQVREVIVRHRLAGGQDGGEPGVTRSSSIGANRIRCSSRKSPSWRGRAGRPHVPGGARRGRSRHQRVDRDSQGTGSADPRTARSLAVRLTCAAADPARRDRLLVSHLYLLAVRSAEGGVVRRRGGEARG